MNLNNLPTPDQIEEEAHTLETDLRIQLEEANALLKYYRRRRRYEIAKANLHAPLELRDAADRIRCKSVMEELEQLKKELESKESALRALEKHLVQAHERIKELESIPKPKPINRDKGNVCAPTEYAFGGSNMPPKGPILDPDEFAFHREQRRGTKKPPPK